MALYFVRHGETDWNREGRFQSRSDVPLNATGLAQAERLRDELARRGVVFAAARCSPLQRARRTADILLADSGLEPVVEPAFIELNLGAFEGRLEAELEAELGAEYRRWRQSHYTVPAPGGGETLAAAAERVRVPLTALRTLAAQADVLIVGHQGVNMAMKAAVSGRGDAASAQSFRQTNDQVDVWDPVSRRRVETFRV